MIILIGLVILLAAVVVGIELSTDSQWDITRAVSGPSRSTAEATSRLGASASARSPGTSTTLLPRARHVSATV